MPGLWALSLVLPSMPPLWGSCDMGLLEGSGAEQLCRPW